MAEYGKCLVNCLMNEHSFACKSRTARHRNGIRSNADFVMVTAVLANCGSNPPPKKTRYGYGIIRDIEKVATDIEEPYKRKHIW